MANAFYGRERELALLKERLGLKIASLIVIKGRRRIGKSRLAEEFGKSIRTISIEGLPPDDERVTAQSQRDHFAKCLNQELGIRGLKADDWDDLFWHLGESVQKGRVIILLDEINWMGSKDPTFLGKLKTAWDKYFKKNPQLICILSGSMSAWIEENILSSTGFLGRISIDMTLEELSLAECNSFWSPQSHRISSHEKFKILSVTGGVPRYLEEIDPKIPADDMIYRLCFRREGLLFSEFDRIFTDLFSKKAVGYQKILMRLADGSADLTQICDSLQIEKGGQISKQLADLEETQYISRHYAWNLKSGLAQKINTYRLKDNYLRFYLKYIYPNKDAILKGRIKTLPSWESIMGLQFENLVVNNFRQLHSTLKVPTDQIVNEGPYIQTQTKLHRGCQIDYLLQLKHNSLYVCEIKYSSRPIGIEAVHEVQEKINRLHHPKVRFSVRPVLIHVNGITDALKKADYFTNIIDFSDLLKS